MSYIFAAIILIYAFTKIWGPLVNLILPRLNPRWVYNGAVDEFFELFDMDSDSTVDWYKKRPGESLHLPVRTGTWRPKEFAFVGAADNPPATIASVAGRIASAASAGFAYRNLWARAYSLVCVEPTAITLRPRTWFFHRAIRTLELPRLGYSSVAHMERVALVKRSGEADRYKVIVQGQI